MIYSITAQYALHNSLFIDAIISMNSNDTQPAAIDFAYTNETLDPRIRLIPVQSDSSESDSDKENIQPDVLHDAEDPDVPRTASASPHEEGEIIQGTGETSERTPDLQEGANRYHLTNPDANEESEI